MYGIGATSLHLGYASWPFFVLVETLEARQYKTLHWMLIFVTCLTGDLRTFDRFWTPGGMDESAWKSRSAGRIPDGPITLPGKAASWISALPLGST